MDAGQGRGASEHNRRAKYYALTKKGRLQLAREEREWRRIVSAVMVALESSWPAVLAGTASVLLVLTVPRLLTRFWGAEAALRTGGAVLPDWRVFAFLTAIGLFAALLTSLAPALEARSLRVSEALQGTRRRIGRTGRFRMRQAFVAVQVGACCVLLVVAGSVVRTVSTYTQPDIRTDGLLTIELWEGDQVTSRLVDLATELTAIPGVRAVAASDLLPLVRETGLRMVTPGGTDDLRPYPVVADVSPAYFNVFDIPLEAGRHFAASDWVPGGARPVVVSRQFAERVFGGTRAVGQTIVESGPDEGRLAIVGIVGNRLTGLSMLGPAMTDGSVVYRLLDPAATAGHLTIWTAGDPTMVAESVATRLRQLTGSARTIEPFASVLAERSMMARNLVLLLVALGGIALLLAVLALIASVTADAARRTREFAIRIALGASPGTVRRHVVRAGVGILPIGIAVGLLASWGVLRLVEAQRILPLASIAQDPVTYGGVLAVVTGTAFLAVFRIAIRVAGRDPLPALREE